MTVVRLDEVLGEHCVVDACGYAPAEALKVRHIRIDDVVSDDDFRGFEDSFEFRDERTFEGYTGGVVHSVRETTHRDPSGERVPFEIERESAGVESPDFIDGGGEVVVFRGYVQPPSEILRHHGEHPGLLHDKRWMQSRNHPGTFAGVVSQGQGASTPEGDSDLSGEGMQRFLT